MNKQIFFSLIFLFFLSWAKAAVVHTTTDVVLNFNVSFTQFDIAGTPVNFSFWGFESGSGFQLDGTQTAVGMVEAAGTDFFLLLEEGEMINASGNFKAFGDFAPVYYGGFIGGTSASLADEESGYFGFQIKISDNIHYGWVKITRINQSEMIINEYAYEDVAGVEIAAGAIEGVEPSSIELTPFEGEISVYNPTNTIVINTSIIDFDVKIFSMTGALLINEKGANQMVVQGVPRGTYVLRVSSVKGQTSKVIYLN